MAQVQPTSFAPSSAGVRSMPGEDPVSRSSLSRAVAVDKTQPSDPAPPAGPSHSAAQNSNKILMPNDNNTDNFQPLPLENSQHPYNQPALKSFEQPPSAPAAPQNQPRRSGSIHRRIPFIHRRNPSERPHEIPKVIAHHVNNLNQPLENNNSVRHSWHPDSLQQRIPSERTNLPFQPQENRYSVVSKELPPQPLDVPLSSSQLHQMATTAVPSKYPSSSEEWKERGAASIIKTETDGNGNVSTRIIKKGVQDFEFGRTLGIGSYSTVVGATDKQNNRTYAIKILDKRHIIKEKKVKYVDIEKNTLNRLGDHPGIVRLYYTFQDESSLYFVIDFASNGELLSLIKRVSKHGLLIFEFVY